MATKTNIATRENIETLVNSFYDKVRKDSLLGPIFNTHIAANKWTEHLINLADFWETNLFKIPKFAGNPTEKHIAVDKSLDYGISQVHFGKWLQLWFETIDELFEGEKAQLAKDNARKMSTAQFLAIWNKRPKS